MEAGLEGEKKKPPEGESKTKRKMKTAAQLEILEQTYTEDAYPSEALRAELSVKLELSDRQLQMWFCHRRLKDRKATPEKRLQKATPAAGGSRGEKMLVADSNNEHPSGKGPSEPPRGASRHWKGGPMAGGGDAAPARRYFELQQTVESRAVAFVEAQLGEPLREDGPILGMEFEPLPPGAFGAPIGAAMVWQQKQSGHPFDAKIYERSDAKLIKGAATAFHEYQFIPEQPTVKSEAYERLAPSYHYGSPSDGPNAKNSLLPSGCTYLHGNEHMSSGYGFQGQMTGLNLMSRQGRSQFLPSVSGQHDIVPQKNSLANANTDFFHGTHPISQLENPFIASDRRRVTNEEDVLRVERKFKSEEARVAREVEAHEKRIQKELEKQEILRRKREDQMRKEMERHDRERRKEEERLLREKQREEDRYQREQRRELERREKFLQKESIRAEKMKQKEELRREKEAAKLRAAKERAISRRIAKESMELIDDERLELMELAASSKGLPSVLSLDYETLQNLELYRDLQTTFPSKDVQLKIPFEVEPWIDSEDNIGSLLMVWRFLITFADVLGLWSFTLDELVQAFHDYDPRLLGEIHISLLRSIIKDIEDVARTPSTGLGSNHTSAPNLGGGHPLIVEGAYAWGFDIRSWQRHLNPLTWPEILRQFALSAGFGPQVKRRNVATPYLRDDNEGNDGEKIVYNLRSGAAVENAFAKMQERGFSNLRRSRHRLTPGTVKFAAFHVLSLEGEKGLTILEVADRIQKSGLRDLTTSKTPEASIAAALSRDTKLFERTAPSTYCVRAAYRKDPVDAEAILSAARERIGIFKSGFLDGEDAEDGEREEDTDSDAAEDPDADDLGTETIPEKEAQVSEVNEVNELTPLGNGKERVQVNKAERDLQNVGKDLPAIFRESYVKTNSTDSSLCQSVDVIGIRNDASKLEHDDPDIDESNFGEPWVQGLMEGEYSDLTVDERLNALVALIGVAVEGNSIRLVLEERLDAANALKKQMWAEMQVDKRRMKEEYVMRMYHSPFMVNKSEPNPITSSAAGRLSPFPDADEKNERTVNLAIQEERRGDSPISPIENCRVNSFPTEGNLHMHDISAGADNHLLQQPGYVVDRPRSQLKSFIGHKAEEMYVYRSLPLGQDRRRNRYWQFITSASQSDPGCGRIFVEFHGGRWRLIDSEEGFDALLASLDTRGVRESYLHTMLQKIEIFFKKAVRKKMLHTNTGKNKDIKTENVAVTHHPDCNIGIDSPVSTVCFANSQMSETSTSFVIELGRNENESGGALKRYRDLERWIWKECFSSPMLFAVKNGKKRCKQLLDACDDCHGTYSLGENHCPYCLQNYDNLENHIRFSDHVVQCKEEIKDQHFSVKGSHALPLRIRLLKLLLALIEVSVPLEALQARWTESHRKSWATKLNSSSSAVDLLQVLTLLESAVKREFLCSDFETSSELLDTLGPRRYAATDSTSLGTVTTLPWVPLTTAAVALRVMEFDAAIFYALQQKLESLKDKGSGNIVKLSSKYHVGKNPLYDDTIGTPSEADYLSEDNWGGIGVGFGRSGHRTRSRGKGRGRSHGSRSQRRATGPKNVSNKQINGTLSQALGWKGRQSVRGRKCGRRSIRSRRKPEKRMVETSPNNHEEEVLKKSLGSPIRAWNAEDAEDMVGLQFGVEEASSSGRSEFDDENGQGSEDEYGGMAMDDYRTGFNGKSDDMEGSDYIMDRIEDDVDGDEDNDEVGYDIGEDEQGDFDVDGYINGDSDEVGDRLVGKREQNIELEQSSSSEYSD